MTPIILKAITSDEPIDSNFLANYQLLFSDEEDVGNVLLEISKLVHRLTRLSRQIANPGEGETT